MGAQRLKLVMGGVFALALILGLTSAGAAQPAAIGIAAFDPYYPPSDCSDWTPAPAGTGLPDSPCAPQRGRPGLKNVTYPIGLDMMNTRTTVQRAKLRVELPPMSTFLYLETCAAVGGVGWIANPCPLGDEQHAQVPSLPVTWLGEFAHAWVASPPGSPFEFGTFPPVTVHTVAFGAIPVTATVHLTQTVTDGVVDPMRFTWFQAQGAIDRGVDIPGYGPPPDSANGYDRYFGYPAGLVGTVRIRLSDVAVDGVPMNVGQTCMTSPTTLNLENPGGYFSEDAQTDGTIPPGQPGAFNPVNVIATNIGGTIDIPAFRGCGSDSDDLDPLITSMVSGPDNQVTTQNSSVIYDWCDPDPKTKGSRHDDSLLCATPPTNPTAEPAAPKALMSSADAEKELAKVPQSVLDKMKPRDLELFKRAIQGLPLS